MKDISDLHIKHADNPAEFDRVLDAAIEIAAGGAQERVERLARLPFIEYESERRKAASELGVRLGALDAGVNEARRRLRDRAAEAPADMPSPEPEATANAAHDEPSEPIDGAKLLDALFAFIRSFVILNESQAVAVVLWIVHTHAFEAAESTPYLAVNSAEKRCGKTRLLEVLDLLVARAWLTGRTTGAALIRKVSSDRATLLLDESDAVFNGEKTYAEALRGILNSGHRRGGSATLSIPSGDGWEAAAFDVFSPKAIAGIGKLPDTVVDRSIAITLRRRNAAEPVGRFRRRKIAPEADRLRQETAAWALANLNALREAEPRLPDELDDRSQDGWEPLLAIADQVGGSWAERARADALVLSGDRAGEDDSIGVQLLRDVQRVFDERSADRLHSDDLLRGLHSIAESPWATWRNGNPMGPSQLATRLRAFAIRSKQVKIDDTNRHGYLRADFEDAFSRYLAISEPRNATDATTQSYQGFSAQSETLPEVAGSVSESAANPCKHREVAPVAFRTPYLGESSSARALSNHGKLCRACKKNDLAYDMADGTWLCRDCSEGAS